MNRLLTSLIIVLLTLTAADGQSHDVKVIAGATLIDSTGRPPIKDAVIIIEGARIRQVGAKNKVRIPLEAEIIDGHGKFVIPGLADMHNHLGNGTPSPAQTKYKQNLEQLLAWGITLTFDPGIQSLVTLADLKKAAAKDTARYPHFYGVGLVFTTKGGHGPQDSSYRPEAADEARAAVRELKAASVDAVKLIYDDMSGVRAAVGKPPLPMLKPEVMAAIIDEAHKQGLKAYVHVPILKYAKDVLRAGADGLLHGILSDPVDDEFIGLMKKNHAVYVTTLALMEALADITAWTDREADFDKWEGIPKAVYETFKNPAIISQIRSRNSDGIYVKEHQPVARENLRKLSDSGLLVVAGTDTGVPGVLLGVSSQMELTLLVEAGLKPAEAIRAATINAARMVGRDKDIGSIEVGKLADLVILDGDPLSDIRNIGHIFRVIKGGVVYDPVQVREMKEGKK